MKFRDPPTAIATRQMSPLFDSNRLERPEALERGKVALALAQILMQAAGVRVKELDDDEKGRIRRGEPACFAGGFAVRHAEAVT